MQVFKAFFKVLRASFPSTVVYLAVFIGISLIFSGNVMNNAVDGFTVESVDVAVINRDGDTPLLRGLTDYLSQGNHLVDLPDDSERLQDALFYREVSYIVLVEDGFTNRFLAGEPVTLDAVKVPDSTTGYYCDQLIEKYLSTARLYREAAPSLTEEQLTAAIAENLAIETPVILKEYDVNTQRTPNFVYYYQYMAYVLIALMILTICTILMVFNQPDLRRRNLCAPLPLRSVNAQVTLGCAIFTVACWAVLVGLSFLLYGKDLLSFAGLPMLLANTFAFALVSLSIGFLVSSFIKSFTVLSAISNVVSLGLCFISGVFVPQAIMSPGVLTAASFLPAYWYVKANNAIGSLAVLTSETTGPIWTSILVQLGFAAAFFSVALFITKQRRVRSN